MTINKTDPRLTAFVLGELSADEAAEIQLAIDSDADLQTEIAAIRQTVAQIETVMSEEALSMEPADGRRQTAAEKYPANKVRRVFAAVCNLRSAVFLAVAASLIVAFALPIMLSDMDVAVQTRLENRERNHESRERNEVERPDQPAEELAEQHDDQSGHSAALRSRIGHRVDRRILRLRILRRVDPVAPRCCAPGFHVAFAQPHPYRIA
jgi:hypothetical protein